MRRAASAAMGFPGVTEVPSIDELVARQSRNTAPRNSDNGVGDP